MATLNRNDLKARYEMFDRFALEDQRSYYNNVLKRYRDSARQVNRLRALAAFATGLASAVAGFIVQSTFVTGARCAVEPLPADCGNLQLVVSFFIVMAVAMPALGAFFSSLADLYQWDRLITIYDSAVENIEFADAQSPLDDMGDEEYRQAVIAYTEGTLLVMQDETAQWGQSIRTPPQTAQFIQQMRERSAKIGGDIDASSPVDDHQTPPSDGVG